VGNSETVSLNSHQMAGSIIIYIMNYIIILVYKQYFPKNDVKLNFTMFILLYVEGMQ
jgi:hypothetical protein